MSSSGLYVDLASHAYSALQPPLYRPQSPTHLSGNPLVENFLNPPSQDALNTFNQRLPPGRRNAMAAAVNRKDARRSGLTSLAQIVADEERIAQRKRHISRFGAGWIRPPGVQKTKQTMDDDEFEAREAQTMAERERAAADAREAQERADAEGNGGVARQAHRMTMNGDATMDQEERDPEAEEEERDLDDEIPEAVELGDSSDDYDDTVETSDMMEDIQEDPSEVTEASHRSLIAIQEDEDEEERDLDDDVPEGGDYEHTDTEVESSGWDDSRLSLPNHPVSDLPRSMQGLNRQGSPVYSGRLSGISLGLDSSLLLSSPTAVRGQQQQSRQPTRRNE